MARSKLGGRASSSDVEAVRTGASVGGDSLAARGGQEATGAERSGYTVVARRFRPQRFEDVVGQDHVVGALRNALRLNRVTHAYVFCGTRGVGKTSLARIFAKCLNCVRGPTESPCNECDICRSISVGQDVDVIEIDGASNNGVEQVRELRQNAGLRPARSRFKIYYIDEVHMLTTGAFNALLKTLEEPPGHVKFLFATTEPGKIPITVLSRCQRYDLAGISPESIARTLESVCRAEGIDAEPEAVAIVARRASGSMRDALSLLEPLLAMGLKSITGDDVRRSLGLASDERLIGILEGIADHEAGRVLTELDAALSGGVQPGEVLAGVSELARDVMVGGAGGAATLMGVSPAHRGRIQAISTRWSLDSVLAALEIFSQARLRLRGSAQPRLVVELTLVRAARLENMVDIGSLLQQIERLAGDAPSGPTSGSKSGARDGGYRRPDTAIAVAPESANGGRVKPVVRSAPTSVVATGPTSGARSDLADGRAEIAGIRRAWGEVLERLDAEMRGRFSKVEVDEFEPPALVFLGTSYNWLIDTLDRPELLMKIETLFEQVIGQRPSVRFRRRESVASPRRIERHEEICADPLVAKVIELFEARPVQIEAADALDDVAGSGETSEC